MIERNTSCEGALLNEIPAHRRGHEFRLTEAVDETSGEQDTLFLERRACDANVRGRCADELLKEAFERIRHEVGVPSPCPLRDR